MKKISGICLFITLLLVSFLAQCEKNDDPNIRLKNITLSPPNIAQPGSEIENIADGKHGGDGEIFHTLWEGIPKQDISIEADLEGKRKKLEVINIIPRSNGVNGIIKTAQLWIMTNGEYQLIETIESDLSNSPIQIELEKPIMSPEKIKLVITDSYGDRGSDRYMVSLGEIECGRFPEGTITKAMIQKDAEVFSNLTGTALEPDIKKRDIKKMQVPALKEYAQKLYNKTYEPGNLIAEYQPYLSPWVLGKKMRIGDGFSKYEGITGIILDKGENIIFVGETNGAEIKLLVPDWLRKPPAGIEPTKDPAGWGLARKEYKLTEGANHIHLEKGGNVYVQYFVDESPEKFDPITVHFPTGKFNGYFDITRGDNDEDFDQLLETAISPILDMRGYYTQVAFPVDSLKVYTQGKGTELLNNFDKILKLQRDFLGWTKEGFVPKNHILARVNFHYYMFRDQDGVAYKYDAMRLVADPQSVITGDPCWGFSHEAGHVNQMRPQMTWGGMTEVSNNILTMYCHTTLGNTSRLKKSNIYAKAREIILDENISYMDFPGKADGETNQYGGKGNTDVFQRLVPFWQLHLYFTRQGYSDFYPDLMIAMRKQEPLGDGKPEKDYLNMLEFCRLACEVSQTDLTEFFQRWGFFYAGELDIRDYGSYNYNITQEEVDSVKAAIAKMNLPKPKVDITQLED